MTCMSAHMSRKYILEDFLTKVYKLTPNVNNKIYYNFTKRKNFKVLNETKKIHLQKKDLTRENLVEFSILFIKKKSVLLLYGIVINFRFVLIQSLSCL